MLSGEATSKFAVLETQVEQVIKPELNRINARLDGIEVKLWKISMWAAAAAAGGSLVGPSLTGLFK